MIGFYIVEYEQNVNDRAKYGDRLLKRLAEVGEKVDFVKNTSTFNL